MKCKVFILFYSFLLYFCSIFQCIAEQKVILGVAPNTTQGLHVQLMKYIAQRGGFEFEVAEVPFERRLRLLESGKVDVSLGVFKTLKRENKLVFIETPYNQFKGVSLFIRKEDYINIPADLSGKRVAIVSSTRNFSELERLVSFESMIIPSFPRCVKLLLDDSIDAIISIKTSGENILKKMKLEDKIKIAHYQPPQPKNVYIVLSQSSVLIKKKKILEQIALELANGKYDEIREQHYINRKAKKKN
ncbi:substrate-binding periplasmic protein [Pseudoalteromonas sp.]|uniref:substrate-binding periplasmic protein n=1 Tax=Pseudoalteromonas sp. TaxID=53249 RepID=UPI003568F050